MILESFSHRLLTLGFESWAGVRAVKTFLHSSSVLRQGWQSNSLIIHTLIFQKNSSVSSEMWSTSYTSLELCPAWEPENSFPLHRNILWQANISFLQLAPIPCPLCTAVVVITVRWEIFPFKEIRKYVGLGSGHHIFNNICWSWLHVQALTIQLEKRPRMLWLDADSGLMRGIIK